MKQIKLFEKNKFYIVRANGSGVFLCKILSMEGTTLVMTSFRRLYYWSGALDVSQISQQGVLKVADCKFSVQMSDNDISVVTNVIEFHPVSKKALDIINSVPVWKN